tara:strand:+ start:24669 stop:25532 length:864 start_codon:yes stop_codon:yes gene_type:complete
MANARGKTVDTTFLSIDQAEQRGFLHRDYIAHCLRWTHVVKFLGTSGRYKSARVLDVGCGKEMPLAKLLHSSRMGPAWYGAVDMVPLITPEQFRNASWKPHAMWGKTDVCDLKIYNNDISDQYTIDEKPTVISCFEVAEHVEPEHCRRMLAKFLELLEPESGRLFISTPCYDEHVGAAKNHVNEMTYQAFGAVLEDTGFEIEGHWGTFASMKDYKDMLTPAQREVWDQLRDYYDTNYLATVMAPLVPQYSRNVLWQCKVGNMTRKFPNLRDVEGRWGSSEVWQELQP